MTAVVFVLLAILSSGESPVDAQRSTALSIEGWTFWKQGKLIDAEASFTKAIKFNPQNTSALNGLGWANFNGGKTDPAIDAFRKTVEIDPDHTGALNGLGQAYLAKGQLDEAEKPLLKAAARDAKPAWYGLAKIYLLRDDFDRALPWVLLIVNEEPTDEEAGQLLSAVRARRVDDSLREKLKER